jgi:hypothetical protein
MGCQEATKACLGCKKPTSGKAKSGAVLKEILKEEDTVKSPQALKKQRRDQDPAVGDTESQRN